MQSAEERSSQRSRLAGELRQALSELETLNARLGTNQELPEDLDRAQQATHRVMNLVHVCKGMADTDETDRLQNG